MDAQADGAAGLTPPESPEPPAPVQLTSCPAGWRELVDETSGVMRCDPWPDGRPRACPPGQAHFPGEAGCADLGPPCPPGDFATDLPTDTPVIYVLAGSSGDGTLVAPLGTISEGLAATVPRATVAVGKGTYNEFFQIPPEVTVHGACVDECTVRSDVSDNLAGVVNSAGRGAVVKRLTVGSSARFGLIAAGTGRELTAEDVVVDGVRRVGVAARESGVVDARGVLVRGTTFDATAQGPALAATGGGRLTVDRAFCEDNGAGLFALAFTTQIDASNVAIQNPMPGPDLAGRGLEVPPGPNVTLRSAYFEGARGSAMILGSDVTVDDVVSVDGAPSSAGDQGRAMTVLAGSDVEVSRAYFARNTELSIWLNDGLLSMRDALIVDTRPQAAGGIGGSAIHASVGRITVERGHFEHNVEDAIHVSAGAEATFTDLVASDTQRRPVDDALGHGLVVSESRVTVQRALFEDNEDAAIEIISSAVDLLSVVVRRTRARQDGTHGHGVRAFDPESSVTISQGLFEENREVSLLASVGARLELEQVVVRDTLERACADSTCRDAPAGIGVGVYGGAYMGATRFEVRGSPLCGIQVGQGGEADLHDGLLAENAIACCVQDGAFDPTRLTDGVLRIDNEADLDTSELPIPSVVPVEGP